MPYVGIHLHDEVIVGDCAISLGGDRAHQLINFIIIESQLERVESMAEFMAVDESVAVSIEHCKGFLHVKVVDEESCGNLVKNLVQSLLPELNSFKAFAESMQVHTTNA